MYRKVKSEEIFDGKILNLKLEYFEKDDKVLRREIVDHKDAVAIFPIDEKGYVYLVKQYRFPIQEDFLEIPAGLVEIGENYARKNRSRTHCSFYFYPTSSLRSAHTRF